MTPEAISSDLGRLTIFGGNLRRSHDTGRVDPADGLRRKWRGIAAWFVGDGAAVRMVWHGRIPQASPE